MVWGISLVFAFALMNWSIHTSFKPPDGDELAFPLYLYMSGTTLTTLGLGDVIPRSPVARLITVSEAGLGLGFVALASLLIYRFSIKLSHVAKRRFHCWMRAPDQHLRRRSCCAALHGAVVRKASKSS